MSVYALNLLRELVQAGHDVTMISQYRGDALGMRVYGGGPPPEVPGVRVIGIEQVGEQTGGDFETDVQNLQNAIIAEHDRVPFDILHAQYGYPCGWATLLASRKTGVPNIVSIQGGDGHWVGSCCETHRAAMVRVLNHAGAVLIGCNSFAKEVTQRLGTDRGRFTIVPGAVDVGRFTSGRRTAGEPVLLYHGRVDARKGVLDMLAALAPLVRERLGFRLVISGIGPSFDDAAAAIRDLDLAKHVEMTGYVRYEDVPSVYALADIFVSPTYAEGFSNTILEAMASGLAIVSCRAVGVMDCITDEVTGLLTEPGDVAALTQALRRVLTDEALRRRLAGAGLAECREKYSWQTVGQQIASLYQAKLGTQPDLDWPETLTVTPCRFRAEPHLL